MRRRKDNPLETAILQAAIQWRAAQDSPEDMTGPARNLVTAVDALLGAEAAESARCKASGVGGDPAWPNLFSCTLPADHIETDQYHLDANHGRWRSAR